MMFMNRDLKPFHDLRRYSKLALKTKSKYSRGFNIYRLGTSSSVCLHLEHFHTQEGLCNRLIQSYICFVITSIIDLVVFHYPPLKVKMIILHENLQLTVFDRDVFDVQLPKNKPREIFRRPAREISQNFNNVCVWELSFCKSSLMSLCHQEGMEIYLATLFLLLLFNTFKLKLVEQC